MSYSEAKKDIFYVTKKSKYAKKRQNMSILEFLPSLINMNKTCNLLSLVVL